MSWSVVLLIAGIWTLAGFVVAVALGGMLRRMDDAEEHEADISRHRADVRFMRHRKKAVAAQDATGSAGCPVASQMAGQIGRQQQRGV